MKKHLFLFILALAVLSVSNVWADCTNSMSLDVKEDRVIPSACSSGAPGKLEENANYYGYTGFFWDWKGSEGELYYMVTLPASTYSISISIANTKNAWMNIYSTTYSENGSCTVGGVTYYKQSRHDMDIAHGEYKEYFNTETASSISLSAGTYVIGIYGEHYTAISELTITAASDVFCDCTAPSSVTITGTNKYLAGQTISLTATPSGGSGTATYQWQKEINSVWTNINNGSGVSGATTNNLQITSCDHNNSGQYHCIVSTGEDCSTTSGAYGVHVFSVYGHYYGGAYSHNEINWTSGTTGTATIHLNASSTYMFKVWSNDGYYYGNGNGNYIIQPVNWNCGTGNSEMRLFTGPEGDYTFTVDIENALDNGTYVNVQVAYPSVTHPVTGYVYLTKWWDCYPHCWDGSNNDLTPNGYDPQITTYTRICGTDYWYMPALDNYTNVYFKNNPTWASATQHGDETSISGNSGKYYTHDGSSWGWHSFTTYTISFAAGDGSGSMSSITGICPSDNQAITANSFTAPTGYKFSHWTANVDVTINSATVTAGSAIADEATLQSIGSNITLTAHWSPITYTITLDKGDHGAANKSATVAYDATSLTSFTAVTATGYNCTGYYDGSTKVLNIDGSFAGSNVTGYITSSKWSKADNCTLTAKWEAKTTTITIDANTTYHGSTTPGTVTATWGSALPSFTAASGVAGYGLVGYYTGANDGTKIINADGTLVKNVTGYTSNDATPVWIYETSTLTLYPHYDQIYTVTVSDDGNGSGEANKETYFAGETVTITATPSSGYIFDEWTTSDGVTFASSTSSTTTFTMPSKAVTVTATFAEISCWSSRTYQVEDIMITTAGAVTDHDTQATPSNVKIITSENQNYDSNTDDYFASISDGAFVYNTQAGSAVYMEVDVPSAGNYTLDVYSGKGEGKNVWVNVYTTTYVSGDHISYGGTTYYKQYYTQLNKDYSTYAIKLSDKNDGTGVDNKAYPAGKCIIGIYTGEANCALDKIVLTRVDGSEVFCKHTITVNNTSGASSSAIANKSKALSGETVTVTAYDASDGYRFTGWTATSGTVTFADASSLSTTFVMPDENVTLTANYALDELTISSLPWAGSQNLTGQTVVSAEAISSCFDSEITFTFMGDGTVSYYDNTDRETPVGTVTSGTAITLDNDLRTHGIYIRCTSGDATLTAVSKTTIGSVYQIWSGTRSSLGPVEVGDWSQQVVLGPEHFQTAIVGDVLRVNTSGEDGSAQGALQYIYTEGGSHIYKGLDNSTSGGLRDWSLSSEEKSRHYFEITINATHLANLQRHGVIVKGRYYTIQSVELRASCSNQTMRTSAPDVTTYGADGSIDIMTNKLELEGEGFNLGNWEHKVELDERCFNNVTVGSIINFYMKVQDGATLSFRCNVDSIHAESYQDNPPRCPSYGDISFDRTIHNLYGDEPQLIGRIEGYKVLYLLVDADMLRRLQETGMILCGKGTLIKVVEGVPETVVVNSNEDKKVPTVVNNLTIYQGGEVTNDEDIEVLGKITYIRPAKDDGKGGKLGNKLDQWYTFALPFTVDSSQVYDVADERWYDINAVYYSGDDMDQANDPDGAGHYYLQYLKAENETVPDSFITRWQYITPGYSKQLYAEDWEVYRYGYPKKDTAYIILFDSEQPTELAGYWDSNPTIRYVGVGPQTIDGVAKKWKVEADGEQYWMYANNTLHSFTLTDAYILNEAGTYFELKSEPTIRPFECYVQATESLKTRYAAIPMRGFHIDNTPTGAESIQGSAIRTEKILRNGQLIIIRNGVEYDATGVVIR